MTGHGPSKSVIPPARGHLAGALVYINLQRPFHLEDLDANAILSGTVKGQIDAGLSNAQPANLNAVHKVREARSNDPQSLSETRRFQAQKRLKKVRNRRRRPSLRMAGNGIAKPARRTLPA